MKICLPLTARPHLARQKLLIEELKKYFDLSIWQPESIKSNMSVASILYATEFNNYLAGKDFDAVIVRGDRYEMLGIAMVAVYRGLTVIHIEGGDLSGVIDNKVRHAITQLSDYHFCTNEESHKRLINMGISPQRVWNFGSLDVEFAGKVRVKKIHKTPYILVAYHPIEGEDESQLNEALTQFNQYGIIKVGSNTDYGRQYGTEQYSPEDYINLMRGAMICIGNSSSLLKEASILGTPVVLVGDRQDNRLKPKNVVTVPCETHNIKTAIMYQLNNKKKRDLVYYQPKTSKKICSTIRKIFQE
jgi:UDP-N-acetylglucosamine 2-epimerase (non-hydrolysing)